MSIQWPLVIFTLLVGWGAGLYAFIGVSEVLKVGKEARSIAAIIALVLIVVGGIASVFHLGHPSSVMSAVAHLGSFSGISVELMMLALTFVLVLIYLVLEKKGNEGGAKVLGIIGIVVGVLFCYLVGNSYVMQGRPAWDNMGLPLAYMGSGLAMGGATYLMLMVQKKSPAEDAKKMALYVVIVAAISLVAYLIYGAMVGFGNLDAISFWLGAVACGAVLPLVCGIMCLQGKGGIGAVAAGLAGAVIGGVAFRVLMWTVGSGFLSLFSMSISRGVF